MTVVIVVIDVVIGIVGLDVDVKVGVVVIEVERAVCAVFAKREGVVEESVAVAACFSAKRFARPEGKQ